MKLATLLGAASVLSVMGATAGLANTVTVDLSFFLQDLDVENSAASTASVESIIYSLGDPGDGIATWDADTGGGVASDFLTDNRYFQTVMWDGLSIASGAGQTFSGLDIDLIETLVPLSVTGAIVDEVGTSLVNAFITVNWSDGSFGSTALALDSWRNPQEVVITSGDIMPAVPLPAALPMALLGLGLLGGITARRRRS